MKPWRFLTVLLVTAFLLIPVFQGNAAPTTEPSAQAGSDIHEAITTAVMDSVEKHTDVLAFQLFHMQVYQIFLAPLRFLLFLRLWMRLGSLELIGYLLIQTGLVLGKRP